jgi:DUF971 family protein
MNDRQDEIPSEVRVVRGRSALVLRWEDGADQTLDAVLLRGACRCSECVARRFRDAATADIVKPELSIVAVEPIGSYAINIAFSDGHLRGIFPWSYLRELAAA